MTTHNPRGQAGRREWFGFVALLIPLLLVSMDVSILYFAVPFVARDLAPSSTEQLWILDIYGFVLAGLLITMGGVGDRIGRRRLLLAGAVAFSAASLLAAYASSPETLILARALLGIGGATLMPSTLGLIRNLFPDETQRNKAVAIWTAALSGGVALGPLLCGLLLERFWWGSVFLVNVPFMVLLLIAAPLLLPEFKNPAAVRFDLLSALLSLAAILPVVYGVKQLAADGPETTTLSYVGVGVLMGVLFVWRQIARPGSLIDIDLFRRAAFSGSILVNLFAMLAIVGFAVYLTQYLQLALGMDTLEAALWSLVPTLVTGGLAPAAVAIGQKVNRAYVMAGGFLLAAAGFTVLSQVQTGTALWFVLFGGALYAGGLVAVISLVTGMVLAVAPPERAGSASALLESGTELGGALGIAILGSVGTAVYRGELASGLPAALPETAADQVRESLANATAVATQIPQAAGDVLTAARSAFLAGFDVAATTAAAIMLTGAVVAVVALRKAA
ncbi:MFS transporter [Actinoplanes couchii]|uniref:MFS transporter n=1 Tax=Actinoplanes couchii TaxID=403638 RepID=A0ABQ3XEP0_9ACTN|nr:MFS transporter [Actinoplanes couchii]MDR6319806.1 DHA2 family multidrug resistance protein-like MFS transporter [Actinoplanes couchii]GID56941.1 MFS transporter [Actinoplanes couchii]